MHGLEPERHTIAKSLLPIVIQEFGIKLVAPQYEDIHFAAPPQRHAPIANLLVETLDILVNRLGYLISVLDLYSLEGRPDGRLHRVHILFELRRVLRYESAGDLTNCLRASKCRL
ncbi:hypothetical protein D3C77_474220 [compost metagenome]